MGDTDQLSTLAFRVGALEQSLKEIQAQLRSYVPVSESELQLQVIRDSLTRMERDVTSIKEQIVTINSSQNRLQIRVLWGVLSAIGVIVSGVLVSLIVYFLTHLP